MFALSNFVFFQLTFFAKQQAQQRFCVIAILVVKETTFFHIFVSSSRVNSVSISATSAKPQDVSGKLNNDTKQHEKS